MSIQHLPTSLLYQIVQSVPFPDRWETLLVCKSWYDICTDPYLYQEINLEYMELKMLVKALQWIEKRPSVSIRRLKFRHLQCDFLAKTVVPVTSSTNTMLYSQLRTLTPHRRRQEYMKHDFRLYDTLSASLARLLTSKLTRVDISHCDLDWAMTNLFTMLIHFGAGRHLTTWIYHDNYTNDNDFASSTCPNTTITHKHHPFTSSTIQPITSTDHLLLQAFVKACPDMKHFMGHHGAINDAILMTMARAWPQLESLVLPASSLSTRHPQTISAKAFYTFLSQCPLLHTLELDDLACMNQVELMQICHWRDKEEEQAAAIGWSSSSSSSSPPQWQRYQRRSHHHQPYAKKRRPTTAATSAASAASIGHALCHVKLTKYITTPLSAQAIMLPLLNLFPYLQTLTYETNRACFDMAYDALSSDQQWHALVQWQQQQQKVTSGCDFRIRLTCPPTMDQLLLHTSRQVMI